jgi:malate dehydrogenase (quinone)
MLIHTDDERIDYDVVLIGAGVMSATLGALLKELQPDLHIGIYERLDKVAAESSDAWNNAGTGHSALCELNYTPQNEDGSVDISKAIKVAEQFELSKQFWAYLVGHGYFESSHTFINSIPHCSFVWGEEDVAFLRKRYEAMRKIPLFEAMQYSEDHAKLMEWMPLMMRDRDPAQKLAATYIEIGTDVDFGALTRGIFQHLKGGHDVDVFLEHEVHHIKQSDDQLWHLGITNRAAHKEVKVTAKFVFIGAGGGSLRLLEKSDIEEGKGFGGFPVSGKWLICKNEALIEQHHAKVYGKAAVGAPPMSVPHLDTRMIDGKKALLFGPYAGFTTKFLKEGSLLDLPLSIHFDNISTMFGAWIHNLPLTKYLIEQVTQGDGDRMEALREFIPKAVSEDWELATAGQRVQVIKKDPEQGGVLEFGTEVIASADHTIAALLGASPGASTSVAIMLDVMQRCFDDQMQTAAWRDKLHEMIPTYGKHLADDASLTQSARADAHKMLDLTI